MLKIGQILYILNALRANKSELAWHVAGTFPIEAEFDVARRCLNPGTRLLIRL